MQEKDAIDGLTEITRAGSSDDAAKTLKTLHPADIALVLDRIVDNEKILTIFATLDNEIAAETLISLQEKTRELILTAFSPSATGKIIGEMDSDDAADILAEVEEELAEKILDTVPDEIEEEVIRLMEFDEDTAGGIMQTELFSVNGAETVEAVINKVQNLDDELRDTIHNIFVCDNDQKLIGLVPLRELIFNPSTMTIEELIDEKPTVVTVETDQEEVAELFKRYDLISVPVVDDQQKPVGRIMIDDIVDVLEEEASEDIIRLAGADDEALVQTHTASEMAWYRLPWLGSSLAGGLFTGWIIWQFKVTIKEALALTVFIPVVMGVSGNVGAQSSALIIRGIATGKVNVAALGRYILKETVIGAFLGVVCGLLAGVAAYFWQGSMVLGFVVGVSIFLSVIFAAIFGATIPLFFRWMKIDPAIAGGPIVLAVNDLTGVLIFFGVASALLAQFG